MRAARHPCARLADVSPRVSGVGGNGIGEEWKSDAKWKAWHMSGSFCVKVAELVCFHPPPPTRSSSQQPAATSGSSCHGPDTVLTALSLTSWSSGPTSWYCALTERVLYFKFIANLADYNGRYMKRLLAPITLLATESCVVPQLRALVLESEHYQW